MMSSLNLYSTTQDEKHSTRLLLEVSSLFFFFFIVCFDRQNIQAVEVGINTARIQPITAPFSSGGHPSRRRVDHEEVQHSHSSLVSRPSFALDCAPGWQAGLFVSLCIFGFFACICLFWSLSHLSFVTIDQCPFLLCR